MEDQKTKNAESLYFPTSARPAVVRLAFLTVVLILICIYVWFLPGEAPDEAPPEPSTSGDLIPRAN